MKDILKQHNNIKNEIKELETRIDKIKNKKIKVVHDNVKGSNSNFPYQPQNFNIEGYNFEDIDRKEERIIKLNKVLSDRKASCEDLKVHIEEFISEIPDSLTRRVFQYRYIDELNWQAIAMKIGKCHESYPRRDIHDKYLEGLE
ncbi:MAG: hypothetical protein RBR71_03575 [Gudongella sp.]|nr:hypothetical protein [Gudongella sp.]